MRLVVDAQTLQTAAARRGMGRYARNLLGAIARARPSWRIVAVVNTRLPPVAEPLASDVIVRTFTPPLPMNAATRAANQLYFGDWLSASGEDAILELSFFDEEAVVPQFAGSRPPLAGIAYDLIPLLFHEQYLRSRAAHAIYRVRFRQFLQSDLLLAISETTRRDVLRLAGLDPARVITIGGAVEPASSGAGAATQAELLARLEIDRDFLLYVGGPDPRKNLRGTLAAFATLPAPLRARHHLVIVCELTADQRSALQRDAEAIGIAEQLRLTGYVDDESLRTLYETCRLSIFPSFYEGLGLPVLEALACGAPVVASDRSAVPEFAPDSIALLADPGSSASVAAAIERALAQERAAGEQGRRDFAARMTWDAVARRAAAALGDLRQPPPGRRAGGPTSGGDPAARPRIVWVPPVPPEGSPASRNAAAMLPWLTGHFEIEIVLQAGAPVGPGAGPNVVARRPAELWDRHRTQPYDLFIYHLDAAAARPHLLDLLEWHSGLIVLHEAGSLTIDLQSWVRLLAASEGVVVHHPALWRALRRELPALPVFLVPTEVPAGPAAYVSALHVSVARRARRDGEWIDAVSSALAEAAPAPSALLGEWARLRASRG